GINLTDFSRTIIDLAIIGCSSYYLHPSGAYQSLKQRLLSTTKCTSCLCIIILVHLKNCPSTWHIKSTDRCYLWDSNYITFAIHLIHSLASDFHCNLLCYSIDKYLLII